LWKWAKGRKIKELNVITRRKASFVFKLFLIGSFSTNDVVQGSGALTIAYCYKYLLIFKRSTAQMSGFFIC